MSGKGAWDFKPKKKRSFFGYILEIVFLVFIIGGIIAFFRLNQINSIDDVWLFAKRKSVETEECYRTRGKGCITLPTPEEHQVLIGGKIRDTPNSTLTNEELKYKGPSNGEPFMNEVSKIKKDFAISSVTALKSNKPTKREFNEKEWSYFAPIKDGNGCWTTKDEILSRHAVPDSLVFLDEYRKETKDKSLACSIKSGKWIDPYSNKVIKDVSEMTVDHVVPLKVANNSETELSAEDKVKFANDLDSNLISVSKKSAKEKNNQSIANWTPKGKRLGCTYAKNYASVLNNYNLSVTEKEKEALITTLSDCAK